MVCSKCGQECAEGVKFCTNCGVEIAAEEVKEAVAETVAEVKEEVAESAAEVKEEVAEAVAEVKEAVAETVAEAKEEAAETVAEAKEEAAEAVAAVKEEKAEEPKEKKEKKPIDRKKAAIAAIILLVVCLIAMINSGSDGDYVTAGKNAVMGLTETEDNVLVIYADGKAEELKYESYYSDEYSQDRSVVCFENEDDELVVIRNGKVKETGIEDAENVVVSAYGDTIAYLTDIEIDYNTYKSFGTLNLYYTKNGKTKEIAEDVLEDSIVLSPNGETVAFVSDYEASDDFKGYYSVNGKDPVEVGKEKQVFAIADKAAYIYYVDDDRIYAQKKKKDGEKLASDVGSVSVFVNADCTQLLFVADGKTYFSEKAGEKEKVSNDSFRSVVLPGDALQDYHSYGARRGNINVYCAGVENFEEQLYYANGEIVYMNKKHESDSVTSTVMDYAISADGESLVYIDMSMDVVKVTKFNKGGVETEIGDDAEATSLYASGDLKYVYYVNEDDELNCIKGKKTKKLADDVTSVAVSADGEMCYYVVEDEELCYSKKNGKKKEIKSAEDGIECESVFNQVFAYVENEDESTIYIMDGKKMKEVYTEE
ncbi:MAG: zinc ribbon domain-containing protein [Lachnospiraceae bacterium]|nr:zinc ribbon domain-containing protein [Lachnospiraceae bacterium]